MVNVCAVWSAKGLKPTGLKYELPLCSPHSKRSRSYYGRQGGSVKCVLDIKIQVFMSRSIGVAEEKNLS
jgi:hypothetical protein